MRGVDRASPPGDVDLGSYQRSGVGWGELAGGRTPRAKQDYSRLLLRLRWEFSGLCAFCERRVRGKRGEPGPIEHFRPRGPAAGSQVSLFGAELTFDWLNLMYACPECQAEKGNKWPGTLAPHREGLIDSWLIPRAAGEGWTYRPVPVGDGYVSPNGVAPEPAEDYFEYDGLDCRISPAPELT